MAGGAGEARGRRPPPRFGSTLTPRKAGRPIPPRPSPPATGPRSRRGTHPFFQPRAIPRADLEARAVAEDRDVATGHGLVHLGHAIEVHDRGAVDAGELRRIETGLQRAQGLADQVDLL